MVTTSGMGGKGRRKLTELKTRSGRVKREAEMYAKA